MLTKIITQYGYDIDGRIIKNTDGNGNIITGTWGGASGDTEVLDGLLKSVQQLKGSIKGVRVNCFSERSKQFTLTPLIVFVCGGQGIGKGYPFLPNFITAPGMPTPPDKDYFDERACKKVRDNDTCFEDCIQRRWAGPRPRYGIPFGQDCQEYDHDINKKCAQHCKFIKQNSG